MAGRDYTPYQQAVIHHDGGHAIVSAVAGSGKTETLVGRLRHLLKSTPANRIAVVMFNKDAARDFRRRFEARAGGAIEPPEIRTFNSMGQKICQRLVGVGALPNAKVETRELERRKLAKLALNEAFRKRNGPDANPDRSLLEAFIEFLSLVKSDVLTPEDVFDSKPYSNTARCFPNAFSIFERIRVAKKIRFYEDQLYDPVMAFLGDPSLRDLVSNRLDWLIADEAQDVNGVQIELMKVLAGESASVMIVGDEDQCIYAWRGAKPEFMVSTFEHSFPNATRYTLPNTFRFGHAIALAANHVISHNRQREPKLSLSAAGTPSSTIEAHVVPRKSSGVAEIVEHARARGCRYADVAVLVRTYDLAVPIEIDFLSRSIPYHVYGRAPLINVPEISAMVGVLQLAAGRWSDRLDSEDRQAMLRNVLAVPSLFLDANLLDTISEQAADNPHLLAEVLRRAVVQSMRDFQVRRIRDRADSLSIIIDHTPPGTRPGNLLRQYLATVDFEESMRKQSATKEDAESKIKNVAAFIEMADKHDGASVEAFLDELDPLIDHREKSPPDVDHVWISSVHGAKGAEWREVVVPGLSTGSFPSIGESVDREAERRLYYVAITRARDRLHLMHPKDPPFEQCLASAGFDGEGRELSTVSPFVWESELALSAHAATRFQREDLPRLAVCRPDIANAYLQAFGRTPMYDHQATKVLPSFSRVDASGGNLRAMLPAGTRLRVDPFGEGTVEDWKDQRVVRIVFDSGDSRLLVASMMSYAPL